jgi:hypothetical protein
VLKEDALYAWDASPIATSRLSAELWEAIRNEDWSLGSVSNNNRPQWPQRLWDMNWLAKHPRFKLHFTPTSSSWINLVERCLPKSPASNPARRLQERCRTRGCHRDLARGA